MKFKAVPTLYKLPLRPVLNVHGISPLLKNQVSRFFLTNSLDFSSFKAATLPRDYKLH
ncbi:hypothetical protein Phi40:1_gp058 [Cellulophaga phage phi40:1]|uniref:Uncharacterized protein n=1 Tax=Cellulophaga phage phi38:1 TaxID=1327977 RepID=S0A1K8_9CAUD|nr:hypothetical protein Phi38:1_gp058 [Cellulophaga phage phi38:1]AGO47923.1 hypothetical protein Phi40:1_gp058 [Cellulophaga phage phi40:1]AGO48088.1 hypothetical protein Phi38:1_gp058 [Cellulophaga phage phi38:1]